MRRSRQHLADGRGFTLVELLVALTAGIVVLFGATSLIIVSFHFSSRIGDSVNAVQEGRTAMEQLLQELSSGCLVNDVSPIQATTAAGITPAVNSDGNHLVFVTGLGDSATATPTEHVISIQNGALIDTAYSNTGGSPPALNTPATWAFSATPKLRRTLLEHVTQINGSTPLFQYMSYANASNPTANSLVNAVPLSSLPLTAAGAASVAEIDVAWLAGPPDGLTDPSRALAIRDSAVFRLTPASPTGSNYPCD